jgi:predicted DNA-binding transcriptional regulator AlpA
MFGNFMENHMPDNINAASSGLRPIDQKALEIFDTLPDSANVRLPVVVSLFGISRVTVWRWTKQGRLPTPRRPSEGVTVWNVGDLRQVLTRYA